MALYFVFLHLTLLLYFSYPTNAQFFFGPVVNVSTTWINNPSSCLSRTSIDGSAVRIIFNRRVSFYTFFGFGFYGGGNCTSYQLSVFVYNNDTILTFPSVIWSSNRNNLVRDNATLEFTQEGDLILRDVDNSFVWSTNTTNRSIVGLTVTDLGNLVLFNANNSIVWKSSDYPTDTLVLGNKLSEGQRLIASVSKSNSTEGLFSLFVNAKGLFAYVESNPPVSYFEYSVSEPKKRKDPSYMIFMNGSVTLYILNDEQNDPDCTYLVPPASSIQFLKLDIDGHLRVFESEKGQVADIWQPFTDVCAYPLACGNYGICSLGQCTCPQLISNGISFFKPIDDRQPNLGCYETTPLSCQAPQDHILLHLEDITYFHLIDGINSMTLERCKEICLGNCSCKAAFFRYLESETNGECFIQNDVFSLIDNAKNIDDYKQLVFIKVQMMTNGVHSPTKPSSNVLFQTHAIKVYIIIIAGLSITVTSYVIWKKKRNVSDKSINYLDQLPGMPTRFSYKDLRVATKNFSNKLGEGGFGTVYEGTLTDGTKVAVKRLYGLRNMKSSFLVEVETISSIHHVNLVRFLGYCVDASHQLLVYEYMCNGSLDNWIYSRNQNPTLDWQTRKKIILDIAKGLTYLHEECEQKIVHLDIKPQNILLDNKFNAKVSDFGLSKLIDREQSKVMTTMRGTLGYLAPEWLSSVITEKVDVFSFGIVVIEMLCGRKNLDFSQPEECIHLLSLLEKSAKEDQLQDMVDKICEDMELPREEAVKMMKVADWCLQNEYSERPSMSVVVKILEGAMDIEVDLASKFSSALPASTTVVAWSPLLSSVLSGPR
ncbi:hypothetical protein AQUCO_03900077v1 [Aquilegia coerulea]|uniref:Receptor-like serine/threonine-protein kinase n=1 Tax=Aquilegia coerulea TaxID=218851 RepID=A0A2G5CRQ3_AQUCA|nr:hypothetical protein AQUCO_03900077v1 [Aquilegia coerulea]